MKNRNYWFGGGVVAFVAASGLLLTGITGANAADPTPVTIAQLQAAHDQIASGNATVQAYIDAQATPTTPPTTTPAGDPQAPTAVGAAPADGTITLSWAAPTTATGLTGYVYGRDGNDTDNSGVYESALLPTTTAHAVLDKLINGTAYHVYVAAVYADGSTSAHRVTLTATPAGGGTASPTASATASGSPTASPTTTTTAPASARLSGLPYSSGVWADGDQTDTASFVSGPRGGTPLDNILVYTSRNSVAAENNPGSWRNSLPTNFNGVTQDLILGVTTWTSDNAFMTGSQGQAIGTSLCSVDGTHPVVRLDWEMNLQDGAGSNGAALTAANYSAWVARFRAVATGIKAGCPSALIDFNINHGADQTTGCNSGAYAAPNNCSRQAFQSLKDVIDIYGIDTYDSYPPVTSSGSGWSTRTNPNAFGELENVRLYALANGKKFSVPEWGVACNGSGCQWSGSAGGDDPTYMHDMVGYFVAHAADMSYETYFNERATYILSDLISNNTNSRNQYRSDLLANRS
jgi:hypothetical protein